MVVMMHLPNCVMKYTLVRTFVRRCQEMEVDIMPSHHQARRRGEIPTRNAMPANALPKQLGHSQNSPSPPCPTTLAVHRPTRPHQLTFHPLQRPSRP